MSPYLLQNIFYFTVWFLVYGLGPTCMAMGLGAKRVGFAWLGCVFCWVALTLTVTTSSFGVAFNLLSVIPISIYTVVSTFALLWVIDEAKAKK